MEIQKVERDGKVAVLVSGGFGAGWSTWMDEEHAAVLLYHPKIVELVEQKRTHEITQDICKDILGILDKENSYVCVLGASNLRVEWIEKGSLFEIEEYDGSETLHIIGSRNYNIA